MRTSTRATLGAMIIAVVAALVVFAIVLTDSQRSARDDLEQRFRERAQASAALTSSLFESASGTARAGNVRRYGAARISATALERRALEGGNRYLLVLDARGRILAASSGTSAVVRRTLAARPAVIREALAGRPYSLSGVQGRGATSSLTYAQSFPTPRGRRVLVTGLDGSVISGFLGGSLRRLPRVKDGRQYVLDARGAIVATSVARMQVGDRVDEAGLLSSLRDAQEGDIGDGRYFVTRAIDGTPWRVVRTAPHDELFGSVEGIDKWAPWMLFVGFGLAAFSAVALVRSVLRGSAQVVGVNAQLAASNAEMELRAVKLAAANDQLAWTNTELGRSNEELERFASIASHDLQEPLRKVQMFSERVTHHEGDQLSDRGRDYLSRMNSAARRMQELIDGLLVYSRVTMQARPEEDVDLGVVAGEVVEDLQVTIREASGSVHVGALPRVPADALQMRQLLQNLIANGLRFRRPDVAPEVRVEGRVDGALASITVTDNGIGIEERHAQRIFNVFERLHPRSAYPGTGMGLALCRRIVERHGGTIGVQSTPGAGSTFTVSLPLDPEDRRRPPAASRDDEREEPRLVRT